MNSGRGYRGRSGSARAYPDIRPGVHAVEVLLDSGQDINRIWIQRGKRDAHVLNLLKEARLRGIPVQEVPAEKLQQLTPALHQGIVAQAAPIQYLRIEDWVQAAFEQGLNPLLMVTDGITDVRNLGALARSAWCLGADALLIPGLDNAQVTPDAIKASAGALELIPVCRTLALQDALKYLSGSGFAIVGASEKSKHACRDQDLAGPLALVMGAEDHGLSSETLRRCDALLRIPMPGRAAGIGSLNVSVAAGILLYECLLQRQKTP
jgi:23S rRNA (guanosine2251-2'-O)-methyltransferase